MSKSESTAFAEASADFRRHLPDLQTPRFQTAKTQNAYEYADAFERSHVPPWLYDLTQVWKKLLDEPFEGITSDGNVKPGLFELEDSNSDIDGICSAADTLIAKLSPAQRTQLTFDIGAREWRAWSNPEFLLRPLGLRLEDLNQTSAEAVLAILEASFSPEGYQKARAATRINHFLGQLCEIPTILNEYSYNFLLFGKPSRTEAWGWSLYGHHLCVSVFLKGCFISITPTFTGAEPNIIDEGPWAGTQILHEESRLGGHLMRSLPQHMRDEAQIYKLLHDPAMVQTGDLATDRWNQDDQRHLCGAFRDNRIVPYEGVRVSLMTTEQQSVVVEIVEQFLLYYPRPARELRKTKIREHFAETYFSWIGGYGEGDAHYFRLQSPVIILEFDHHSGVFLSNQEPAMYHIHTIVRTPNGGDYGNAVRPLDERLQ